MTGDEVKAIARRFLEAQDELRGGPDDGLCADGYRAHLGGNPPMDLGGHKAFAAGFYAAFPDLRHQVEQVHADGDVAAVRFRLTGTNTGAFMGNPPSGREIDVGALALMTVDGGKVVELRAEFDQLGLMQQIGLFPSLAPA